MTRDPFDTGDVRTRGDGDNLAWWHAERPGYRLVGRVDGVFKGSKVEFVKFTSAVIFRTADHKPLAFYPEVAMVTMDAKVRSDDAGAMAMITAVATREGKKAGVTFIQYETRIAAKGTEDAERVAELLHRARVRLDEEKAHAPLPQDDDDLPF